MDTITSLGIGGSQFLLPALEIPDPLMVVLSSLLMMEDEKIDKGREGWPGWWWIAFKSSSYSPD